MLVNVKCVMVEFGEFLFNMKAGWCGFPGMSLVMFKNACSGHRGDLGMASAGKYREISCKCDIVHVPNYTTEYPLKNAVFT